MEHFSVFHVIHINYFHLYELFDIVFLLAFKLISFVFNSESLYIWDLFKQNPKMHYINSKWFHYLLVLFPAILIFLCSHLRKVEVII